MAKVSLAGVHYPDTTGYFGDLGIIDVTGELGKRGWPVEDRELLVVNRYRAAVDMVVKWALSDSNHCNVVNRRMVSFEAAAGWGFGSGEE